MHRNALKLFQEYGVPFIERGNLVLEVGPDHNPSSLTQWHAGCWDTVDINDASKPTFISTENALPIGDDVYDVVLSANVIEHVRRPWIWLKELVRVTRPGGHVVTICPITWPCHRAPLDCWRIYPDGMATLYEDAGLEMVVCAAKSYDPFPKWPWRRPVYDTIAVGRKK